MTKKKKQKKPSASPRRAVRRTQRVFERSRANTRERMATAERREAAAPRVPEATIAAAGGPVSVEIVFGHAQHGTYTIQLFDPTGRQLLASETGLNTDGVPDQFTLQLPPARLDQHFLQWSGAVDAFSPRPGQRFSVTFRVLQGGRVVPDGEKERAGALDITQAFLGVLKLVTR
jgi:hypothetical protein